MSFSKTGLDNTAIARLLEGEAVSAEEGVEGKGLRVRTLEDGLVVRVGSVEGARLLISLSSDARTRIRRIDFTGGLGLEEVTRCLERPGWGELVALAVDGNAVQARQASLAPGPDNIVWFFMDGDDAFFRILEGLSGLTRLRLCENRLGVRSARRLGCLVSLEWLEVRGNQLGDEGVTALGSLRRLRRLDVSNNGMGAQGAESIASLVNLRRLDISRNQVGLRGMRGLCRTLALEDLRASRCGFGPAAIASIAQVSSLKRLDLSGNPIGMRGVGSLVRAGGWQHLWLGSCGLGDEEAMRLGALEGLERLDLRGNRLSEATLACLVDSLDGCSLSF